MNASTPRSSLTSRSAATSRLVAVAVALLPVLSACSSEEVRRYGQSRALDLLDVVPVSVAAGVGLSAEARVTPFLGLGLGYADCWRAGSDELRFGPLWWEEERGVPLYRYQRHQDFVDFPLRYDGGYLGLYREYRKRASSLLFAPGVPRDELFWFPVLPPYFVQSRWEWNDWTSFELLNAEVGLFVGLVGVRVGVSVLHLVDFIVGIVGYDPAGDDIRKTFAPRWPEYGVETGRVGPEPSGDEMVPPPK